MKSLLYNIQLGRFLILLMAVELFNIAKPSVAEQIPNFLLRSVVLGIASIFTAAIMWRACEPSDDEKTRIARKMREELRGE